MKSADCARQPIADEQLTIYYYAANQVAKVRALMVFSLFWAVGMFYAAYHVYLTYGLSPGDGGVLAPIEVRISWAAGMILLGLIFPVWKSPERALRFLR